MYEYIKFLDYSLAIDLDKRGAKLRLSAQSLTSPVVKGNKPMAQVQVYYRQALTIPSGLTDLHVSGLGLFVGLGHSGDVGLPVCLQVRGWGQ